MLCAGCLRTLQALFHLAALFKLQAALERGQLGNAGCWCYCYSTIAAAAVRASQQQNYIQPRCGLPGLKAQEGLNAGGQVLGFRSWG